MIAQNNALNETKKIRLSIIFLVRQKNGPLGPKMAIFGQKLQVLAKNRDFFRSKNLTKKFFSRFFRPFLIVFNENKKMAPI